MTDGVGCRTGEPDRNDRNTPPIFHVSYVSYV